jgi:ribosomal protein L37E
MAREGYSSRRGSPPIYREGGLSMCVREEMRVPEAKCLYCGFGRGRELLKESGEMKNKRKYNRNSKVELPKRYKKNKK